MTTPLRSSRSSSWQRHRLTLERLIVLSASIAGALAACSDGEPTTSNAPPNVAQDGGMDTPPIDASALQDSGASDAGPLPEQLGAPIQFGFDRPVTAAVHAKGAWYLGGEFVRAEQVHAKRALALDLNGNAVPTGTCNVLEGFDDTVNTIIQVGGNVFFGGAFRTYRGQPANFIAKVNASTCALDATFSPPGANGFNGQVYALAASADGSSIFAGGDFQNYRGVTDSAWYLAKLDVTTGAQSTTFPTTAGSAVDSIVNAILVDGNTVYLGGSFTRYRQINNSAIKIAKVNATDGTQDTTFSPVGQNANGFGNGYVRTFALSGTSLFVGGGFNDYRGVVNGANNIAKLNKTTGALDTTFSPPGATTNGFTAAVNALAVNGNALYVGGDFWGYKGVQDTARRIAKLDVTTGVLDTTFSPPGATANGFETSVYALSVAGGALYAGGYFTEYRGVPGSANRIAKLDLTTGANDTTFKITGQDAQGFLGPNGDRATVFALHLGGTTLWAGGDFGFYGGHLVNHLVRIPDATGKIDRTFSPIGATGFDETVHALVADENALFVGGEFTAYRGVPNSANRVAKLDLTSGSLDTTFSPQGATANGFNYDVHALALTGTALYVGGQFNAYRGVPNSAFAIAKLNTTTGVLDTTFSPPGLGANGFEDGGVNAIVVTPNALYVGGQLHQFRALGRYSVNNLAKLDPTNGQLDTVFSPFGETANGTDQEVLALAMVNNSLFAGGEFTHYRGAEYQHLVKLNATTGAADGVFATPGASSGFDDSVYALAEKEGALFVGGRFTAYRGAPASASYIAKLGVGDGALDGVFTPKGATNVGALLFRSIVPYGPSVMLGGYFDFCNQTTCYSGAMRANRTLRTPE